MLSSLTNSIRQMRSRDDMSAMFDILADLNPQQRATIKHRYQFLMAEYRYRCFIYMLLFYVLRTTITVGGLAVPSLLSLTVPAESQALLHWVTWGLSLAVTTANGLVTLFKIDKRYFMVHAIAESLRSETWQYLSLAGRYAGKEGEYAATHPNQFMYYTSRMEKIRMRHIDDEYTKQADGSSEKENTAGRDAQRQSVSSVPSPPAGKNMITPSSYRRESEYTVDSNDEVPLSAVRRTPAMPAGGSARHTVLPLPQEMPSIAIVEVGTGVPARNV